MLWMIICFSWATKVYLYTAIIIFRKVFDLSSRADPSRHEQDQCRWRMVAIRRNLLDEAELIMADQTCSFAIDPEDSSAELALLHRNVWTGWLAERHKSDSAQ